MENLNHTQSLTQSTLFNSAAFQHAFLERMGEAGIIILDQQGMIVYSSQRACNVLGESRESMLSKNYFDDLVFFDEKGEKLKQTSSPCWNALHNKDFTQITPFFMWFDNPAGERKSLVVKVTQVKDLEQTFAVIEIREAKRTLKVDEMKTLFISFAAHQLKTPSSIVKGFIELLIREGKKAFTSNQWSHLQSAYEANENLIRLSKNLLNVTKLEGGMIEPSLSEFNPKEIISGKIDSHKLLLNIKNIKVDVESLENSGIKSDPLFFSEIFEILFSNAIKYSPENSKIIITIFETEQDLRVTVTDQGPGVSSEQEELLFQAFNTSQTNTNSHGMGLLMAKKYLDLLNGQIGYQKASGGGSCFFFAIPKPIL